MRSRLLLASSVLLLVPGLPAWTPPAAPAAGLAEGPAAIYVAPDGLDERPGTADQPVRTLQRALDLARAGTVIHLRPGVYDPAETRHPGAPGAPITVRGPETGRDPGGRFRAVVRGSRIVLQINHSHYRLEGFTIDGQPRIPPGDFPGDPAAARAFKDRVRQAAVNSKLVYIGYAPDTRDLTGIVLDNMFLHGAGGECVRMRNNAVGNLVTGSVIQWCGVYPSGDDAARYAYHNGEGVYIGTSPKSTTQPMYANDTSHDNVVQDSLIVTYGSECFQVKENAHHNTMRRVDCRANDEPLAFSGSNVELRGDHNTIEDSTIVGSRGVNLKIASDEPRYDRGGNSVVRTRFGAADGPHVLFKSAQPPGTICGNTFAGSRVEERTRAFARASDPCPSPAPRDPAPMR